MRSKLGDSGTSIFAIMSNLAREHNAINLGQGFPNFDCDEVLRELVSKYLNDKKNQYAPMPGILGLREVIASKIDQLYKLEIDPQYEITVTAGATQALFTAISAFVHSGDEVIILEPAYDSYKPTIALNGGITRSHQLKPPEFKIDWDEMSSLVTDKTRMIIINTPHNPIGKTLKEEDLIKLEQLVSDKDIIVLSDEVYEHLIYDNQLHQSVMRFPNLFRQSLCVFSFGKTFHNTGWKMGYCVAPKNLMEEFRKVHQWNVFSVNSFVQYALADYLSDSKNYLSLPGFYQKKRDSLQDLLKASSLKPFKCEGTFFQLYDYSGISDDNDLSFAKRLTSQYGVASIPVSPFYSDQQDTKLIRLCFAKTDETLSAAAELLCKL